MGAREEPSLGAPSSPVLRQDEAQVGGEHDGAVLAPPALLDADHHALAVDVGDAQVGDFRDAKAAGVQGHEQGAGLDVGGGPEQGSHLLGAHDLGQPAVRPLIRDLLDRPVLDVLLLGMTAFSTNHETSGSVRRVVGEGTDGTADEAWRTATGLRRGPLLPSGSLHLPPPRSGFVQDPHSDVAPRADTALLEPPQGPGIRSRWHRRTSVRSRSVAKENIRRLSCFAHRRRRARSSEGSPGVIGVAPPLSNRGRTDGGSPAGPMETSELPKPASGRRPMISSAVPVRRRECAGRRADGSLHRPSRTRPHHRRRILEKGQGVL